jgi:esterase/lipase
VVAVPEAAALDAWLAEREARVPTLRPGCAKRIDWAGRVGEATPLAVVFIHGFTASARELSPYPEEVAKALGANFHATRLSGHGQDGAAMGRATLAEWRQDVAEALEVGRRIGDEVLAIACSTGATLLALALAGGEAPRGAVMVSPNFALASRRLQAAISVPFASAWAPALLRGEWGEDLDGELAEVWTGRHPVTAYLPMADAIRALRRADLGAIRVPALFAVCPQDRVIDPAFAAAGAALWGGPVTWHAPPARPGSMGHLPAGPMNPDGTGGMVAATLAWARAL